MPKTKINKKVFQIPKSILLIGRILQFISPKLVTSYVYKLFMTPYKFRRPKREHQMYVDSKKEMLLIPKLNRKIQVYLHGDSKKYVLLVHGWAGRGTQLYKISDAFVEKGYTTISFDGTGHGESEGKTSAMPEFVESIFEIEKKYGTIEYAIGHSFGAMALLNSIKDGFNVKKIAIIGSGNSITAICKQFVSRLELKPEIANLLKNKLDRKLGNDVETLSAYIAAQEVKIPTIVIHDKEDTDVPVACAYDIQKSLVNSELLITEGLGHRRILSNQKVINSLFLFFNIPE